MTAKKRIGRPPKAKEDRKAVNFTFRSRGQMRERLQAAAMANGRSISEEIEVRLEDTFRSENLYGGPHLSAVFRILANHIALAREKAGADWAKNDQVQDQIARAFADLLAQELPGFCCVTIEMMDKHGGFRGVTGFASEEIAKRRSHFPPQPSNTQGEDSK